MPAMRNVLEPSPPSWPRRRPARPHSASGERGSWTPRWRSRLKGGYDAVQMRTVAERADVALGTLYRYFPSKIHLLVRAGRAN